MPEMDAATLAELPTLYRGDSLPNPVLGGNAKQRGRTFADYYVTEGLLAKAADGGLSRHMSRPLGQIVAVHIGYRLDQQDECYAAYHSPLISFSSDADSAWHFLDRTAKKTFTVCELEDATHFMWRMSGILAQRVSPGRYRFQYKASTKNVDRFRERFVAEVQQGDLSNLGRAISTQIVHNNVQRDEATHVADIVSASEFLATLDPTRDAIDPIVLGRAREFASRWSEWLVYPMDVEDGLTGFSSRFSLNEWLDLHLFAREVSPPSPFKVVSPPDDWQRTPRQRGPRSALGLT